MLMSAFQLSSMIRGSLPKQCTLAPSASPPAHAAGLLTTPLRSHEISEIEDCAIAVDATYYIQLQLDAEPHEPLLPALGGLTGIQGRIEADLDQWEAHRVTPFFIFDGQSITGQDETTALRGRQANEKTDFAWGLYFDGQANDAVVAFGQNTSTSLDMQWNDQRQVD